MAKSPKTDSTDFSFADYYLDDRKKGKWWRVKVKYPYIEDRRAVNIDYSSEEERRTYGGKTPIVPPDRTALTTKAPLAFDASQYIFISDANTGSNVPEGFYGTSSGIFPIDFVPFTNGSPTNIPVTVDSEFENNATSGVYYVANNVKIENMEGQLKYYPATGDGKTPGRFEWIPTGDYQAPVDPEVRYPSGYTRKRFFR